MKTDNGPRITRISTDLIGVTLDLYVHPQMEQKRLCVELLRNYKQKWTFWRSCGIILGKEGEEKRKGGLL